MTTALRSDLHHCSCFALRKAARRVTQLFDRHLAAAGLRVTQFSILATIAHDGPFSIQYLAERMGMDRTTLARNLRPLERDGLVTVGIDPKDRRGRLVRLTGAGADRVEHAIRLWGEAQNRFEQAYGPAEAKALHRMLGRIAGSDFAALPAGRGAAEEA